MRPATDETRPSDGSRSGSASDTIFAVATGQPPAAIAIMRISGPGAVVAAASLAGNLPAPRHARLRALRDPRDGTLLDRALVLFFQAPASATGEDLVELHLHGGRAVVAAISDALTAMPGLRPAIAGEFTRRALMSGRIDLAEAEGLGDLLMAATEGQRRAALASAEGAVSRRVKGWTDQLRTIAALIEAVLDFSDEDDVGDAPLDSVNHLIDQLLGDIAGVLAVPAVERLRDGIRLVLAGAPNSGKSTLFNALVDREAAIVSPIAGTTRDRIEASIVHSGIAYLVSDTAGLVDTTNDPIEAIGVDRAREAIVGADILLWLDDAPPPDRDHVVWIWPRADVRGQAPADRIAISALIGDGMNILWELIADHACRLLPRIDQLALNARQQQLAAEALSALRSAHDHPDVLIMAEQIRIARRALDHITGNIGIDDVLDTLFSRFCIGK